MYNEIVSTEWYTPQQYIDAARYVMGDIDLDPASCALANETVQAHRYYTAEDDGLSLPWSGRIWLNPPFGRVNGSGKSKIALFVAKTVQEYEAGNVSEAIILTTAQSNTKWFADIWNYTLCFSRNRVHFNKIKNGILVKDSRDSHMLGTVFAYLGPNTEKFTHAFSAFGPVVKRIDREEER
jgi:phage N-6-adenine-methyltransferase